MSKLSIKKLVNAQKAFAERHPFNPYEDGNCKRCLFNADFARSVSPEVRELYDSLDFSDSNGGRWNGCSLAAKVYNELFGLNVKIYEEILDGRTAHKLFCGDNEIYEKYDIRTFKPIQSREIKI